MSAGKGSWIERIIRVLKRGSSPGPANQCRRDRDTDRQSPVRWVSLR